MTRINVVPATELTNKHLMAEYRELPRIFTEVKKKVNNGISVNDLTQPEHYKMGQGHVMFFVSRCGWLIHRYVMLHDELIRRGYSLNDEMYTSIVNGVNDIPMEFMDWYEPTDSAITINRARIYERLNTSRSVSNFPEKYLPLRDSRYKSDIGQIVMGKL